MSSNRIAVLSDIHANYCALEAVLTHVTKVQVDEIWCLGDVINYGPDPNRCLKLLIENVNPEAWVLGNHDEALRFLPAANQNTSGEILTYLLNPLTDQIGITTNTHRSFYINYAILELFPEKLKFLLSRKSEAKIGDIFLVHGGIRHGKPTITYTHNIWDARDEFSAIKNRFTNSEVQICLVGHTHHPCCYRDDNKSSEKQFLAINLKPGKRISLKKHRWLINPGSVGQPRDGDTRASYTIVDLKKKYIQYHRVEYDIKTTQRCMAELEMPTNLINRLAVGR